MPGLVKYPAPQATMRQITRVHKRSYWESILKSEPDSGLSQVDPDTFMSMGSVNAALRGAGAVCLAVEQVMEGKFVNAFCAVRPPGHHAEEDKAMGFCLLNNIAIGAAHAKANFDVSRVAIVDFDVHHGNGTQEMFKSDRTVMYFSVHQRSLFPGTGDSDETGDGNIFNMLLRPNVGSEQFRQRVETELIPVLRNMRFDLMMISAGFDAHKDDPLAQLNLETEDFAWITRQLCNVAQNSCKGRLVSTLEGGYNIEALAASARVHVEELIVGARQMGFRL